MERIRSAQRPAIGAEECQEGGLPFEPVAYALDASRALVLVPCLTGAYQGSSLVFVASRSNGSAKRVVAFAPYRGAALDRGAIDLFTETDFDPATGALSMTAKGRGLADCGMAASWILNGASFDLSALVLQQSCGGVEPCDWPILFRSSR